MHIFSIFITSCFLYTALCLSSSPYKTHKVILKHHSADFTRNTITPRSLAHNTQSIETDQDFNTAKNMNAFIGEAIIKFQHIEPSHYAASSSSSSLSIPRLNLFKNTQKKNNLLEQAYRALGILELIKKKYPESTDVNTQIKITLSYIYDLDPPTNIDGIPESARGSLGRERRLKEFNTFRSQTASSSTESTHKEKNLKIKNPKHKKKTSIRTKKVTKKAKPTNAQLALPLEKLYNTKPLLFKSVPKDLSKTFLSTAKELTLAGDTMVAKMQPYSSMSAYEKPSKKKKTLYHSRFLTLNKKKNKASSSEHTVLATYKKTNESLEHISETYFGALSFYTACYKASSPATSMYIHLQITHILEQLKTIFAPIDLFAPTTIFEPGYKELLLDSKIIIQRPTLDSLIINDIDKKQNIVKQLLQSNPTRSQSNALCTKLDEHMKTLLYIYASNKSEPHQHIITSAYIKQTWQLIHQIPKCKKKTTIIHELHNEWSNINTQSINLEPLLSELKKHAKTNRKLLKKSLLLQKTAFYDRLINDQCQTLNNLLCLHQAYQDCPLQQYWIAKAADKIIRFIIKIPSDKKQNKTFIASYGQWQEKHINVSAILKYILTTQSTFPTKTNPHKNIESRSKQITIACFEILRVLIDLYTQKVIPPAMLSSITDPLRATIETLSYIDTKAKHLNPKELNLIKQAHNIIGIAKHEYSLLYAEKAMTSNKNGAKKAYLFVAQHSIDASTPIHLDPIPMDHMYNNLLHLYECNTSFSCDEILLLERFATHINMTLPKKILSACIQAKLKKETEIFKLFLQQLAAQGAFDNEPTQQAASSQQNGPINN